MNFFNVVSNAFNISAKTYDQFALIPQEVAERMLDRIAYLTMHPKIILDLGCGTGHTTIKIKEKFPNAHVIGIDIAQNMLQQARSNYPSSDISWVEANIDALPIQAGSVDLVFSNQAVYYSLKQEKLWQGIFRVMSPGACLFFSTLGPYTLKELAQAWKQVDAEIHVNSFTDMHDIGDQLLQNGLLDPVIDREDIEVQFANFDSMLNYLRKQGCKNIHPQRFSGLTSKGRFSRFKQAFADIQVSKDICSLTYEIIHAHAWKGQTEQTVVGDEIRLPAKISVRKE